jgi:hypothetical protein
VLAQALGAAGRARVWRELTWDAVYERIRPLYTNHFQRPLSLRVTSIKMRS